MRALRFGLAGAAALVEAAIAIALIFSSNHESNPWLITPFAVSAGLTFVAAGLVALWRRPENTTGFWLAATGYLWFVAALGESNQSWVWTIGFCINNLAFVAFVALILAYPDGALSRRDRWLVGVGGVTAIGANTLAALVDHKPAASCDGCPSSAIAVTDLPGLKNAVSVIGTVIVALVLTAVVAVLVQRWRRSSAAQKRLLRPVFGSCAISVALLLISVVADRVDATAYSAIWILFLLSFMAVPLTFLAGVLRSRFDRVSLARMLLSLDAGVTLRDALAEALHDPSLEIVYWLEARSQWVDADGHRVEEPAASPARSVTTVERHGRRIAALFHDPVLDDEPELVSSLAAAAALALQTERLQAELRAQFEFLTTIVDTAPSLLVVLDTDGRIRSQNRAVLQASGYADEELIRGRYFWDVFIDADERQEVRDRFGRAAPDFAPAEYENAFTNVHGDRRVVAWRSAPVKDVSGEVTSIIAGGLDITERKHQELELRASEERLRAVIDAAPVAIVEVATDGSLRSWNPAAEEIFGWTAAEVASRPLYLVPESESAEYLELLERVRAGHSYTGHESRRIRKDGSLVDVEVSSAPIRDSNGVFAGHMALFADITERRRRDLQLQRERDATEVVLQTIPSLIVVVDSNGIIVDRDVNDPRVGANPAFRDTFGWRDDQLVGRSFVDLVHEEDAALTRLAIASAADAVPSAEQESRWRGVDGEEVVVAWIATALPDVTGRRPSLVLIVGMDVTQRKVYEQEVRASRARILTAGDEARRQLERNLHDGAQQRLVSLSLSLRLAQAKITSDPAETAEILTRASEELALALAELRELARGIHPAVLTDRGLAAALEALAARTPLPIELTTLDERLPEQIEAAAYYVVSEAVTNVVKYAGASSIHVRLLAEGDLVIVDVSDDGVGGADPARGSGLRGLSDRLAALDGVLTVDSTAGAGTRVRAEIPVRGPVLAKH